MIGLIGNVVSMAVLAGAEEQPQPAGGVPRGSERRAGLGGRDRRGRRHRAHRLAAGGRVGVHPHRVAHRAADDQAAAGEHRRADGDDAEAHRPGVVRARAAGDAARPRRARAPRQPGRDRPPVLTAHVVVDESCFNDGDLPRMLDQIQGRLARDFSLQHSTIQFEAAATPSTSAPNTDLTPPSRRALLPVSGPRPRNRQHRGLEAGSAPDP